MPDLRRRLGVARPTLEGISLDDKQAINRTPLTSGAPISEMNYVRRYLSAIKGGRLAALTHPAKVVTLLISDVPGDNPVDIASGLTAGDPTTSADALAIVRRYGIAVPPVAEALLRDGGSETIKPDAPCLSGNETHVIAAPKASLEAAASIARQAALDANDGHGFFGALGDAVVTGRL